MNTIIVSTIVHQKTYSIKEWFDAVFLLEGFDGEIYVLGNMHGSIYEEGNDHQMINDRNKLRKICKSKNADMFLIDSDTIVPPNAYEKLTAVDADIVSALVPHTLGYNTYIYDEEHPDFTTMPLRHADDMPNTGHIERDAVGFGCVILRLPVIQKIPFSSTHKDYTVSKGHDLIYCLTAKDCRFSIKVNSNVVCRHLREGCEK